MPRSVSRPFSSPWILLAIAAAAVVAHGAGLWAPFQFDDLHQIRDNPAFRDPSAVLRFFVDPWIGSSTGHVFFYRPILFITFLVDGLAGAGSPVVYRFTSLTVLVILAVLVRRFLTAFLPLLIGSAEARPDLVSRASGIAAIMVVVHPLLNESVLLASSRSSLLTATFGIAALTDLVHPASSPGRRARVVALTLLALLSKETGVVLLPLALLVVALVPSRRPWYGRLARAWPVVIPVLLYVIAYEWARRAGPLSGPPLAAFPQSLRNYVPLEARPTQAWMALIGLTRLFLVPWPLSLSHVVAVPTGALRWLGFVVWPLALLIGALLATRRGGARLLGFGLLWWLLALMPVLFAGLNTPMAEHRTVLPLVGPLAVVGVALDSLRPVRVRQAALALLVTSLAGAAMLQTLPWRTPVALWTREVEINPESARAWGFLSQALQSAGDLPGARGAARRALSIEPDHVIYLAQAAEVEMAAGALEEASRLIARGRTIEPDHVPLLLLEAEKSARGGSMDAALAAARRATTLAPSCSPCWNALGNVLWMSGDPAAVEAYRRAVEIDPGNAEAASNLRMARGRSTPQRP